MAAWLVTFALQGLSYSDFLLFLFVNGPKALSVRGEDNAEAHLLLCICP
jgi:hypothetical protein